MGLHGFPLWLYLGELALYLAVGGFVTARIVWRRKHTSSAGEDPRPDAPAAIERAETIALAAAGTARLEVVEGTQREKISVPPGLTMQRRVVLDRRSPDEPPATITVTIH